MENKYNIKIDPENGQVEDIEKTKQEEPEEEQLPEELTFNEPKPEVCLKLTKKIDNDIVLEFFVTAPNTKEAVELFDHLVYRHKFDVNNDKPPKNRKLSNVDYVG